MLLGAAYGIGVLRMLPKLNPALARITGPAVSASEFYTAEFARPYHDLFFVLHILPGAVYLLAAPILLFQHRRRLAYSERVTRLVLFCGFLMALWPLKFLLLVHPSHDVGFYVILSIEGLWLWSLWLAVGAYLRGDRVELMRVLYYHYSISISAGFWRLLYAMLVGARG